MKMNSNRERNNGFVRDDENLDDQNDDKTPNQLSHNEEEVPNSAEHKKAMLILKKKPSTDGSKDIMPLASREGSSRCLLNFQNPHINAFQAYNENLKQATTKLD